jgi:primosomal protein N'
VAAFVSVAVPVPFLDLLTYRVPSPSICRRSARAVVPLGSRVITGCIVSSDVELHPEAREIRDGSTCST